MQHGLRPRAHGEAALQGLHQGVRQAGRQVGGRRLGGGVAGHENVQGVGVAVGLAAHEDRAGVPGVPTAAAGVLRG